MKKLVDGKLVNLTQKEINARNAEIAQAQAKKLAEYLPAYRDQVIENGITVSGVQIKGDSRTIQNLGNARIEAESDSDFNTIWAAENGDYPLNAAQIIALHKAGVQHINKCFLAFNSVKQNIENYTTESQIAAAFDSAYEG